jgi:glycosyltransferase involved in cell wall biosynthesis
LKLVYAYNAPPPINGSALIGKQVLFFLQTDNHINVEIFRVIDTKLYNTISDVGPSLYLAKFVRFLRIIHNLSYDIPQNSQLYIAYNLNYFGLIKLFFTLFYCYKKYDKIYVHNHMSIGSKGIVAFVLNRFNKLYPVVLSRSEASYFRNGLYVPNISFIPDMYVNKVEFNRLQLLFMSHLFTWKGVLDILDYIKQLKDLGYNVECRFFGLEGDLSFDYLMHRSQEMAISSNVQFNGPIYSDSERVDNLNWANLVFYPSKKDYAPLFLLECAQYGIPVLSYDVGITSELLDSSNSGYIVNSVCEAIDRTLTILKDGVLEGMSVSTRQKYLMNFGLENWKDILRNIFN